MEIEVEMDSVVDQVMAEEQQRPKSVDESMEKVENNNDDTHSNAAQSEESASSRTVAGIRVTKYGVGVCLILLVAVIWVAASEWIQYIFGTLNYDKPYFLTYFNTTCFSFWNLGFLFSKEWRQVRYRPKDPHSDADGVNEHTHLQSAEATQHHESGHTHDGERSRPTEDKRYSWTKVARGALLFCPMWFFANVLFNYSLSMTSVASNTILSTTSSIWTLILSWAALGSSVHWYKLLAIALSIGGTAMVALTDNSNSSGDNISGDILALVSAFFYGAYTTVLKWCLPDDDRYFMGMVFGCVGMWNVLMFWPGLILLDILGVETFEWPSLNVLWPLFVNTLIGTNLSDVLWAKSVVLTSPFVATLGLSLTTPLAMIADGILRHKHYDAMYIIGAIMVTVGFVVANLKS